MSRAAHRTLFVSDVHLGSRHCHAAELARFLEATSCERLYLVGDIIDLWYLAQRRAAWGAAQNRVVEALHVLRRAGTHIVYVPGNHDRPIRRFYATKLAEFAFARLSEGAALSRRKFRMNCRRALWALPSFRN